jgi:hypothetical protein
VNWSGLELGGGGNLPVAPVVVTASGLAESADYANLNYGDALAVLTGNWGANQSVSITVGNIPATSSPWDEEFEIHLRTDPTTGTGYEITWGYNHNYVLITTWNGGGVVGEGAAYTILYQANTQTAIKPGDTLTASIQGNVITMYTDGVQVAQITDNKFSSGNPGFGFNQGGTGEYGISSFSASSSDAAGTPSATTSSIVASPSTVAADGTSTTTLTVTVKDATGNALANTAVTLSGSGSNNTFGAVSGTTNASGVFTTTLASTLAQSETITATEGSVQETTAVKFVAGAPSATTSSIVASPSTVMRTVPRPRH